MAVVNAPTRSTSKSTAPAARSKRPGAGAATTIPALIRELERLPAQPSAAVRVLWMADDPNSSSEDLAAVVSCDPALTARIMRMANSTYYGLSGRVSSAQFAITVLGFSTVRTMAAAAAAGVQGSEQAVPAGFWSHAAASAVATSLIAPRVGARATEAFSLGLLHDLGRTLLHRIDPAGYAKLDARAKAEGRCIAELEVEAYELDHAEAGAKVLKAWRFPDQFVEAMSTHHGDLPVGASSLRQALYLGSGLVALADGRGEDASTQALRALIGDEESVESLVEQVRREGAQLEESLKAR